MQGAAGLMLAGPAVAKPAGADQTRRDILAVVEAMQQAWNRGDFPGYMEGFWNPGVVFVSGGRIQDGIGIDVVGPVEIGNVARLTEPLDAQGMDAMACNRAQPG